MFKRTRLLDWQGILIAAVVLLKLKSAVVAFSTNVHVITPTGGEVLHPTMILIGGMAQTKASWEHQLPYLSKNRQVIVYECMGQGKDSEEEGDGPDGKNNDVSLQAQAEKLLVTLLQNEDNNEIDLSPTPVDLVGFSFGARVAMATMTLLNAREENSSCIRKLHLTGVATDRSDYGHLAVEAWKECLQQDLSLRSFAWSILMATYSSSFLRQ